MEDRNLLFWSIVVKFKNNGVYVEKKERTEVENLRNIKAYYQINEEGKTVLPWATTSYIHIVIVLNKEL